MSLPDKRNILITGASRGLGRAMAEGFAAAGHVVRACARHPQPAAKGAARQSPLDRLDAVDVSQEDQVRAWAAKVLADGWVPDLLLNNAALINANAPLWEVSTEDFDRVVDVNIKGVAHVIRHFAPAMIALRRGVIVNFSSGWGRSTSPEVAPYCATKWAIEGLTRALAQELPRGMAAIPLNPGIINTDMLQSCFGESAGSYPSAQEWAARAVPFLLDLGPKHNGEPLSVP